MDGVAIKAGDIPKYMTADFYNALSYYNLTKVLGNPNGGIGWVNEPKAFVGAFFAFEQEESVVQQEEADRRKRFQNVPSKNSGKGRKARRK